VPGTPATRGNDLRHDGKRDLLRRTGTDIQSNWTVDTTNLLVGDALLTQAVVSAFACAAAADGANVSSRRVHGGFEGRHVEFVIMGEDGDRCGAGNGKMGHRLVRPFHQQRISLR